MEITSFALNNFAPVNFIGGAKFVTMNSKNVDCIMKAFFDERNKNVTYISILVGRSKRSHGEVFFTVLGHIVVCAKTGYKMRE